MSKSEQEQADPLVERLARLEEDPSSADPQLEQVQRELDGLASALREPRPEVDFETEANCKRVTAIVEELGAEPLGSRVDGQAPLLGELGQYRLLSVLGKGGMGTVYRALHTRLEKIVALKVLPQEKTSDPSAVARFEREMRAVGKLEHANIVRAMDANEERGTHYLVMEYVEGLDLSKLVRQVGPLSVADACELIRQAAVGLQHAHEHGLVHRDIKPSNLMLSQQGRLKILDLGLARLHGAGINEEITSSGQVMGTVSYMAPEQTSDSHDVDVRADIYSLGATLFKLLCGEAPFPASEFSTPLKQLAALITRAAPSIATKREGLPAELVAVIDRMLAKDPADRFQAPREVADALAAFATGADLEGVRQSAKENREGDQPDPSMCGTRDFITADSHETVPTQVQAEMSAIGNPTGTATDASLREAADREPTRSAKLAASSSLAPPPPHVRRLAVICGAAALILAAGLLIRFVTGDGEIQIRSEDPSIEVVVKRRAGNDVKDIQLVQGKGSLRLRSGEYDVLIKGKLADEFKITPSRITLKRRGKAVVTIDRKSTAMSSAAQAGASGSSKTKQTLGSSRPPERAAASPNSHSGLTLAGRYPVAEKRRGISFTRNGDAFLFGGPNVEHLEVELATGKAYVDSPLKGSNLLAYCPATQTGAELSSSKALSLYDVRSQSRLLCQHEHNVRLASFSRDGSRVLSIDSGGFAKVWNARTGKEVYSFQMRGHPSGAFPQISADGQVIAVCFTIANQEDALLVYDLKEKRRTQFEPAPSGSYPAHLGTIEMSHDGRILVSGEQSYIYLWDARTGKFIRDLNYTGAPAPRASFSPDNRLLAVSGKSNKVDFALFETATWRKVAEVEGGAGGKHKDVDFSRDGRRLAVHLGLINDNVQRRTDVWELDYDRLLASDDRKVAEWLVSLQGGGVIKVGKRVVGTWEDTFEQTKGPWLDKAFRIRQLSIEGKSALTDDDFARLTQVKGLQRLSISDMPHLTGSCLSHIEKLDSLRSLSMDVELIVAALLRIRNLKKLDELQLGPRSASPELLAVLHELPDLRILSIAGRGDGELQLAKLSALKSLQTLEVRDSSFREADLDWLLSLKQLRSLRLQDVKLTEGAVARIKQELPHCKIDVQETAK